jgi:hypothetical protein
MWSLCSPTSWAKWANIDASSRLQTLSKSAAGLAAELQKSGQKAAAFKKFA